MARGYRGRDDLTAEAFITDARVPGGRRYRTGDLARWQADGNLAFLGRIDDQVKVRGNRVSPGEVQAVMETCPGVRSAVVIAEPSDTHGTYLIGYFVGENMSVNDIEQHLSQRLPGYMVPTTFVKLDVLPVTPSGKTDRRALPRPGAPDHSAIAPRNSAEAMLVDVFGAVLGVESVGIHDNFFTVGGDSMLALAVRSEAEKRGLTFDIEALFARPTIAELAESCEWAPQEPHGITEPFALLASTDRAALPDAADAFPATALQLGMLFHSVRSTESAMYKDVFRYRIAMLWEERAFRAAFDRLVERHPALRSSFDLSTCSVPVQVVNPRVPNAMSVVTGADDVLVRDYIFVRHSHRYEFDRAPLYSLRAFVHEDAVDLVFAFHHAILDGWSVANLMRELLQDYLFHLGADVSPVDDQPHSTAILADHVRLVTEALEDPAAREFWTRATSGSSATSLEPAGASDPPGASEPELTVLLPQSVQDSADELVRSAGVPMKSILLAAHCLALQRLSGEAAVTTGLVTHGRPSRAGAESVAGLFLNTIPVRLGEGPANWLGVVEDMARYERESYRYRRYPLQAMQSHAGQPLFHTAFNYVNYHPFSELTGFAGIELLDFEVHEQTNFALLATAGIDPRLHRLFLRVNRDPQRVTDEQAHEYANTFVGALTAIAESPKADVNFDASPPDDAGTEAARSSVEVVLADVFASVLGVESMGLHDDFFTVGGDSILALVRGVKRRSEVLVSTSTTCSPGPRLPDWPRRSHMQPQPRTV